MTKLKLIRIIAKGFTWGIFAFWIISPIMAWEDTNLILDGILSHGSDGISKMAIFLSLGLFLVLPVAIHFLIDVSFPDPKDDD